MKGTSLHLEADQNILMCNGRQLLGSDWLVQVAVELR
jgi:hypothetical protein